MRRQDDPKTDHGDAQQLMQDDWNADWDNRRDAIQDLKFCAGDQWTQEERTTRIQQGRPCLTINQMGKFVNQVAGDIRMAQPGIEVFPVDSGEDVEVSKIYEGLIRQIEYQSGAQAAYAQAAENQVRCGIGHWRITTEAAKDSVFQQDIRIRRMMDGMSVIWDANSTEIDRSDAKHCFVIDWMTKAAFEKKYPGRSATDIYIGDGDGRTGLYWKRGDFVRIAEYWYKVPTVRNLVMTAEGRVFDTTEWEDEQLLRLVSSGQVVMARKAPGFKIMRRVMDGADWLPIKQADGKEVLEQPWPGKYIPIVPAIGAEISYDGKIIRHGLVRFAKDPQKLYNIWRSAGAEIIAKSPKAPWLIPTTMVEGLEGYWNNANNSNLPYLPFKPDQNFPNLLPKRQDPPTIPAAIWQEASVAAEDMKNTTGIFDASLGDRSNEVSGIAIAARQREGDTGSFVYTDNFRQAMRYSGQVLVDLIPRIYDTARQVRILDVEGNEKFVPINFSVESPGEEPMIVNDLSHGRFDVRVRAAPSYATAREQAREQMATAMQGNPSLWSVIGDLYFKNSDYPGSEEIAERLKRTMDPNIVRDEETPPPPPDPRAEMAQELALAAAAADIDETRANTAYKEAQTMNQEAQATKNMADAHQTVEETANI